MTSDAFQAAIYDAQQDGHHTAMLIAINVVDAYIASSSSLEEFARKWDAAKDVWECATGPDVSEVARRIGRQAADELRDALAVFEEHRR